MNKNYDERQIMLLIICVSMCLSSIYLLFVDTLYSIILFSDTVLVATFLKPSSIKIKTDEECEENKIQEIKE